MDDSTESNLGRRLVEIDDEVKRLPVGDFARRHELSAEADRVRRLLSGDSETAVTRARRRWAERAGRKGAHVEDPEAARASIVSPNEMGG